MTSVFQGRRRLMLGGLAVVVVVAASIVTMRANQPDPTPVARERTKSAMGSESPATTPTVQSTKDGDRAAQASVTDTKSTTDTNPTAGQDLSPKVPPDPASDEVLFERDRYVYRSLGRADPFQSLVAAPFKGRKASTSGLLLPDALVHGRWLHRSLHRSNR